MQNIEQNSDYLNNVGVDGHVRLGMYIKSFEIAFNEFPFGSGVSTFGSLSSISSGFYSPTYIEYGIDLIGANSQNDVLRGSHTLLDTFWPHIIGELGFLGSFLYFILFMYPIFYARKINVCKSKLFVVICLTLIIFWEGFTLYHPETPFFIFVMSIFMYIFVNSYRSNK